MEPKTYEMVLDWAEMITENVRHFAFRRKDGSALHFTPGQFITLHLPQSDSDKALRRSYSIATMGEIHCTANEQNLITCSSDCRVVEFAASYVPNGIASEVLFALQPGGVMHASGPFGRLVLRSEHHTRYVLVATGTGVTPYRSMLPEIHWRLEQDANLSVVVLMGVQNRSQLLYANDFIEFQKEHPRFQFYACYSRQYPTDAQFYEKKGHVQGVFTDLQLNPQSDLIYLCGNPNMIDEAFLLLQEQGFPSPSVRREKYISS